MKNKLLALSVCFLFVTVLGSGCSKTAMLESKVETVIETQSMESAESEVTTSAQTSEGETGESLTEPLKEGEKLGSIILSDSSNVTKDILDMVQKVFENNSDSTMFPMAYIGSRKEVETIHYILCDEVPNVKGAGGRYVIVKLLEDSNKNVSLYEISYSEAEAASADMNDGWEKMKNVDLTSEVEEALTFASKENANDKYIPLAFVEVNENNPKGYGLLCAVSSEASENMEEFRYINLQMSADGAKIKESYDFTAVNSMN